MKSWKKITLWIVILAITSIVSFLVGKWSGTLQYSLQIENSYPWELHKKINTISIQCEQLQNSLTGSFFIHQLNDINTLIIASYDDEQHMVRAFAISPTGDIASDYWPMECN